MKTKISTFISAIIFLLLGTTTILAQGTNAYFKKNGATVFQTPISGIDSIVFRQRIETNYVDINWDVNAITGYDVNTGEITVQSQDATPVVGENSVIILPQKYGYDIRVIKGYSVSGNTLTVQTEQGDMTNLFKNISFTLSTDPSLDSVQTESGSSEKVITPSEIGIMTADGYKKIYDRSTALRAGDDAVYNIFNFKEDLSGSYLYNNNGQRVYWEKGAFDIGLKGTFHFDFGKMIVDYIVWGKLDKFDFHLDGNLNMDLLLKSIFTAQFKDADEKLLFSNIPPDVTYMYLVANKIPVFITVHTDIYGRYDLSADAKITMSAGCSLQANASLGLTYIPDANPDLIPTKSFSSSFTPYDPSFTAQGSLLSKCSFYPKVSFRIYSVMRPWVAPMPYLRNDFEGGMRVSTDGNNYLGWTSKSYAGMDCQMGLDFINTNLKKSDAYNLIDTLLFDEPKKIELTTPANGTTVIAGIPVSVSFYLSSLNNITRKDFLCSGALVNFSTQGSLDKWVAVSDNSGIATVQWTPKDTNDKLTASIVDKDGKTISETTFTPKYEEGDWILINGVKWATRNVGAPGTFVQNPKDYGEYYQWNKGTTDFLLPADYTKSVYIKSNSWLQANDPSPVGYRVPTSAEFVKLYDTNNVTYEWINKNGIAGEIFTDKTNGNILFLPAAGYRNDDGTLTNVGMSGGYWSSSGSGGYAWSMSFTGSNSPRCYSGVYRGCYSIRPVAE